MSMAIVKKYTWLVIVVLAVLTGIFYFFNRFYHDVKALTDFSYSYEKFDKAISYFSISVFALNFDSTLVTEDLERKANEALIELNIKASERISSLIKNDAEFMSSELEIADLSGKELTALGIYKRSIFYKRDAEMDNLAKEFRDLKNKRTTAYARFQELVKLTK
jgi:hypothetical protein